MPHPEQVHTAALVLAAGASRRLGTPKQLLPFRGEALLRRAVQLALTAGAAPVFVVLNPAQAHIVTVLSGLPVACVPNPDAPEGMGTSLCAGVKAVRAFYPRIDRLLMLVCDQPLLRPEHVRALLALPPPAAAAYNGKLGVPAVFAQSHFAALASLRGDQGARSLLATLSAASMLIPEAAIDIDSPEDGAALSRLEKESL